MKEEHARQGKQQAQWPWGRSMPVWLELRAKVIEIKSDGEGLSRVYNEFGFYAEWEKKLGEGLNGEGDLIYSFTIIILAALLRTDYGEKGRDSSREILKIVQQRYEDNLDEGGGSAQWSDSGYVLETSQRQSIWKGQVWYLEFGFRC